VLKKIHINLKLICQNKKYLFQKTTYGITAFEVMKFKKREKFIKFCKQEFKINFEKVFLTRFTSPKSKRKLIRSDSEKFEI
jgi:hypothetical protein